MTLVESANDNVVVTCRKRIQDHINRVKYFYTILVESVQIPLEDIDIKRVMKHDADKLKYNNLKRQALRYCGDRQLTQEEKQQIHDVVMEHIKSNPHHCEYWGVGDYKSMCINCTCAIPSDAGYFLISMHNRIRCPCMCSIFWHNHSPLSQY